MLSIKKLIYFIVYSNLYVSICAVTLSIFFSLILQFNVDPILIAFVFSSTLFAYNFQRRISLLDKKTPIVSKQNQWIINNKTHSNAITIYSFITCLYFLYFLPHDSLLLIAPLALISLLYVLRIGKQPALRNIPFLKVFIVAFVWGGSMVLLPTLYFSNNFASIFSFKSQSLSIATALFVFGQSLPFDIRDINYDEMTKLTTFPTKVGVKKTIWICWLSFLLSAIIFYLSYSYNFISLKAFLSLLSSIIISTLMVYLTKKIKHHLFYGLLLEGCLILPLIIYYILQLFL